MSDFAPEWLALREGADHRSINHTVRRHLLAFLNEQANVHISDLGCGTGSNMRSLAPEISARQLWMLVDRDEALLKLAATMTTDVAAAYQIEVRAHKADLSSGDIAEIAAHSDLITAAALFDLVSPDMITRMADQIADAGIAFYTVLTYDGIASWLPETDLNATMRDAFNRHQRTDKGFGAAAGPEATSLLSKAFSARGYNVLRGKSPWVLDHNLATLRHETDRGWATAVAETGEITREQADAWLQSREADASAITIVGHEDFLALPPE